MNLFRNPNLNVFNEKVLSEVNLQSFASITLESADNSSILHLINLLKEELQDWELTIKDKTYHFSRNPITKIRFGDIEIGDTFYFSGLKLKKNDNYNALSFQGKEWFIFNRKDMVSVEQNKILYVFVYVRIGKIDEDTFSFVVHANSQLKVAHILFNEEREYEKSSYTSNRKST